MSDASALLTNDGAVFGLLAIILGVIFHTSSKTSGYWFEFYKVIPPVLLCYFVPGLLNTVGIISGESSNIYFVASRYLLPASLILLTLSIDLAAIRALGPKAIIMFLAGTFGVVIGGPATILLVSCFAPEWVGGSQPDEIWRGMAYIAGGWIGGTINGLAMYETFEVSANIFPAIAAADVLVGYSWMAVLFFMAGRADMLDRRRGADNAAIKAMQRNVESFQTANERIPSTADLMRILALSFGAVGLAHLLADEIGPAVAVHYPASAKFGLTNDFLWVIIVSSAIGIGASFTRARQLEYVGASKVGMVFLFVLAASLGMKFDLSMLWEYKQFVIVVLIWMSFHALILLCVARAIRAPTFFFAVGSQANIGGPATAALVAAAFHPSLMPVGIALGLFGYALGTYMAYFCAILMQLVAPVPPY